jgi:hypothetical protein
MCLQFLSLCAILEFMYTTLRFLTLWCVSYSMMMKYCVGKYSQGLFLKFTHISNYYLKSTLHGNLWALLVMNLISHEVILMSLSTHHGLHNTNTEPYFEPVRIHNYYYNIHVIILLSISR